MSLADKAAGKGLGHMAGARGSSRSNRYSTPEEAPSLLKRRLAFEARHPEVTIKPPNRRLWRNHWYAEWQDGDLPCNYRHEFGDAFFDWLEDYFQSV